MNEAFLVRAVVFAIAFAAIQGLLLFTQLAAYRRKEMLRREIPNPGYRTPAVSCVIRDVPVRQLFGEMGFGVFVSLCIIAVAFALLAAALGSDSQLTSYYRAVMPRFDEVPEGHRGVVFDRFGGVSDGDVRRPGEHFVWSRERMGLMDCRFGPERGYVADAMTSDGRVYAMSIRARAAFRCLDPSVRRIMGEASNVRNFDEGYAWFIFVLPTLRNALEASVRDHDARYVEAHRQEITEGILRLLRYGLEGVEVDVERCEMRLRGEPLSELPQPRISDFELPHIDGWSVSMNSREPGSARYRHHEEFAFLAVHFLPMSDGSPETLIRSLTGRNDRRYAGYAIRETFTRGSDGSFSLHRRDVSPTGYVYHERFTALETDRPGVIMMVHGISNDDDLGTMLTALNRVVVTVRPAEE